MRPPHPETQLSEVSLAEITRETLTPILKLAVAQEQLRYVATNAVSIAQASFAEHVWFRGIYAGDAPVGFVMLNREPDRQAWFLWRFMIDAQQQRRGYGRAALALALSHVRRQPGVLRLLTSVVPGPHTPRPFYEACGFVATGEVEDGEEILALEFAPNPD